MPGMSKDQTKDEKPAKPADKPDKGAQPPVDKPRNDGVPVRRFG